MYSKVISIHPHQFVGTIKPYQMNYPPLHIKTRIYLCSQAYATNLCENIWLHMKRKAKDMVLRYKSFYFSGKEKW